MKIQKDLTGSNLEKLLSQLGFKSCDQCKSDKTVMNKQGWRWCIHRFRHLNKLLKTKARDSGHKYLCHWTWVLLSLAIFWSIIYRPNVIVSIRRIKRPESKLPLHQNTQKDTKQKEIFHEAIKKAEADSNKSATLPVIGTSSIFDRVCIINLKRRTDRLESLHQKIPREFWELVGESKTVEAIDTLLCPFPQHWNAGHGWGCYRSHLRIIEECLNTGVDSVLLLEDDFILGSTDEEVEQSIKDIKIFFDNVPSDWGMIWLGGHHHKGDEKRFRKVNDFVLQPYNCQGTYAFAIRGKNMMKRVYQWLNTRDWKPDHHIDHHLGRLVEQMFKENMSPKAPKVYTPHKWLIGHSAGQSNISGKNNEEDEFYNRWTTDYTINQHIPLVAVLGIFRGGTSCVAGILHHLGVHMGQKFKKPLASNPQGFYEAVELGRICRQAYKEPHMKEMNTYDQRVMALRVWGNSRRDDVIHKDKEFKTNSHSCNCPPPLPLGNDKHKDNCPTNIQPPLQLVGGKHPTMSLLVPEIEEAWGPNVKYIVVNRNIEDSVNSIFRLGWGWPKNRRKIKKILERILDKREEDLEEIESVRIYIQYEELMEDRARIIGQICEFLSIDSPLPSQLIKAVDSVKSELHHHNCCK